MKEQFTSIVTVSGKGNTKQSAFAAALSQVQNKMLKESSQVLLRIEPVDVTIINATHRTITDKFLFFFLSRRKDEFSVTLDVKVNVSTVDPEKITFTNIK
ncbi:MAG: DUF4312 family protein [Plesiomonas sp.]|uniref:DUF4312 family protein n=1 Tax=Plesiomonas sp. TaxID=2486279 RepID=UPI003F3144CF